MGERKLICTIDINNMIDISAADYIIRDIKSKVSNEQWQFPIILRNYKWLDSDIVSVKFMVSPFKLENYCDFSVDNEVLGHASVYATEKHDCLEEPKPIEELTEELKKETDRIKKEIAAINFGDAFKKTRESLACINTTKAEESDINNDEKDFEYVCDRCGVRVKTPNTLRGPVNVVDFYREVEDAVGDSVSYRLCQECMQDFFSFLSCN